MQIGGANIRMQFLQIHGNMVGDKYGWEMLFNKSLSFSVTDLPAKGHPSTNYFCGQTIGYTIDNIH